MCYLSADSCIELYNNARDISAEDRCGRGQSRAGACLHQSKWWSFNLTRGREVCVGYASKARKREQEVVLAKEHG